MRSRTVLAALFIVGLAATLAGTTIEPVRTGEAGVVVFRGTDVYRFEAEHDRTVAVFRCSHWYCGTAVILNGDARELVTRPHVYVRASEASWRTVPIDPVETPGHPDGFVDEAYAGPFEPVSVIPRLAPLVGGAALTVAAATALLAGDAWRRGLAWGAAAAVGAAWIGLMGSRMGDAFILPLMGLALALVVGLALIPWRRTRQPAIALVLLAIAGLWLLFQGMPFFPAAPAV